MLSGHCRVNSNWSLFMNSVLSPCFTGIVTLHSVLDCAVNSTLTVLFAGAGTVYIYIYLTSKIPFNHLFCQRSCLSNIVKMFENILK